MKKILFILLSIQLLFATSNKPIKSGEVIKNSVKQKEKKFYTITVPKNKSLHVNLTELEADVDLYIKKGNKVRVRFNDCYSSNSNIENEECILTNKGKSSIYTILVNGFKESSYNLKATIEKAEKIPTLGAIPIKNEVEHKAEKQYQFPAKKGKAITITLSDLTADADLRVKVGRKANLHTFDCKSTNGGTKTEECIITPKKDATVYVHVYGYRSANYSINAVQDKANPCITREELKRKIKNNEDVTDVNTSCITDMSGLFTLKREFNQDISKWDVSNVTNMSGMFWAALSFNQDISKWNVSKVKDMKEMFFTAENFNQDISKWDVSNVKDMSYMFQGKDTCLHFNQDISKWDVSNVTNMNYMFWQNCYNGYNFKNHDLSKWNVKNITEHKNFFNDNNSNNIEPKWRDKNQTNSKLINLAKESCLYKSNKSRHVLCSYQGNIVFIIESEDIGVQTEYKLYKVNILAKNEKVSLIKKYTNGGSSIGEGDIYFPKNPLKSQNLFLINYRYPSPDLVGYISLINYKGKTLISFPYEDFKQKIPSIKTIDHGKKLIVIEAEDRGDAITLKRTMKTYDISNPNVAKLIKEEIIW